MNKIISFFFIFLIGCSTAKIVNNDPCKLEIQHPDILKCLQQKTIDTNNQLDFESTLCDCKKQFIKKYFPKGNQ